MKLLDYLRTTPSLVAYSLVLSVQVVFSAYQIFTKVTFSKGDVDPLAFGTLRMLGAAAILLPVSLVWSDNKLPKREDFCHMVLMGVCMFANIIGLVYALDFTTSSMVAMLQVLRPVFAGLLTWALGIDVVTYRNVLGIVICLTGAVMITIFGSSDIDAGVSPLKGVAMVSCHSIGISLYVIQQPILVKKGYSSLTINAYAYVIASILALTFIYLPGGSMKMEKWSDTSTFFWATTVYAVLFVAIYSYVAMAWAAKEVGSLSVMLFMLLQALFTVIAGHIFLQEPLHSMQLLGGAALVVGIFVYTSDRAKELYAETSPLVISDPIKLSEKKQREVGNAIVNP